MTPSLWSSLVARNYDLFLNSKVPRRKHERSVKPSTCNDSKLSIGGLFMPTSKFAEVYPNLSILSNQNRV